MVEIINYGKSIETFEEPRLLKNPSHHFNESSDFSIKHKKVKDRVLSILKSDKYSRKNDFYLCLSYWIKCGFIKMQVDFKDFGKITKPESISRCRRELITEAKKGNNELNFLLTDKEILEERENLKELNEEYYHNI